MRSKTALGLCSLIILLLVSGCAELTQKIAKPISTPKTIEYSVLSGREGINGPVLVVKIDDTNPARPQIGLEDADVVYIEQVEGGLTRLAAVFSSVIPMRVGPIRSARISDIEIMSQYGRVAFAYSGAQRKLYPVIDAANVANLGAQSQSPTIYTTDPTRNQPHAMVLRADLLMQRIVEKGYVVDSAKSVGWKFGKVESVGVPISRAVIRWPAAQYGVIWSFVENRWLLTYNNEPNLADTGKQLGAATFVIQITSITPSIYGDKFGGVTPLSRSVGTGTGYILRDGKSYTATWSRASDEVGTTWTALDGSEIAFAPGNIWVALTDTEPDFTLISPSAEPSPTK
jgi:hypothetical protein